jgi:hypothetical protein
MGKAPMLDKEITKLKKTKLKQNQNFQIAMERMDQKKLTAEKQNYFQYAKEINQKNFNKVRKLHAELLQRLALKCQVEYQEKIASKRMPLLFKLKATTSINTITNTTTNIDKMRKAPMLDKEIVKLKKIKWKLNQLFQFAMDLMELQVLTA